MPNLLQVPTRAFYDKFAEIALSQNVTGTKILSFQLGPGLKWYITNFGQAWDSILNLFVFYTLRINGMAVDPYVRSQVQITPPEAAGNYPLPFPIPCEQLSIIDVLADTTGFGAGTGNFTARVIAKGYDPKDLRSI